MDLFCKISFVRKEKAHQLKSKYYDYLKNILLLKMESNKTFPIYTSK